MLGAVAGTQTRALDDQAVLKPYIPRLEIESLRDKVARNY
jgi:hypothetical protein